MKPRRKQGNTQAVRATKKRAVRLAVFERSKGECELRQHPQCLQGKLPWAGATPTDHGHLAYMVKETAGGKTSEENCRWGCWRCALTPVKPRPARERVPGWMEGYDGN